MTTTPLARAINSVPAPDSSDPAATIISARLKQRLIEILTVGVPLFDKMTGEPAMMPDGKTQAHRPPSAAELSVCERMVARATAAGSINDHAEVMSDLQKMKAMGWKFPELDTEGEDATSR
jgi:hypothetical protein